MLKEWRHDIQRNDTQHNNVKGTPMTQDSNARCHCDQCPLCSSS